MSGNTSYQNGGPGIFADPGATVIGNTAAFNGTYGLFLFGPTGYTQNVLTDNQPGQVTGGVSMENLCNGVVC